MAKLVKYITDQYGNQIPLFDVDIAKIREQKEQLETFRQIPTDSKQLPSLPKRFWNFTKAVSEFVKDGLHLVTVEQYEARLRICDECPKRIDVACGVCGCYIPAKARARAWNCPEKRWPEIPH